MKMSKLLAAAAVVSLATAPAIAAQPNPAAKLSIANSPRVASNAKGKNHLAGTGLIVALVVGAAITAGIIVAATDKSSSP